MTINPKIFRKYDIRGKALGDGTLLTPAVAELVGRAFAAYLQTAEKKKTVVVGRDNRASSVDLQSALAIGLQKSGCAVIDLGLVATPTVYWHAVKRGDVGGVMITGSHLNADQNGFKLCVGNRTLYGDAIQSLRESIERQAFVDGDGRLTVDEQAQSAYLDDLAGRIPKGKALKVVVDAGNGVGGLFGPQLFKAWGHHVSAELYCEPDATYPNHHPNPQDVKNMRDLGDKVRELSADVGIAFDGDADRMGAVDENGQPIEADRLLGLLARDMLQRHPGEAVVGEVLCSQVLFDVIEANGGRPVMAASGHSLVKEAMREQHALLGGELSGHIFLGEDYFSFDDGFLAAGRLLQLLANSDKTLSQLNDELPRLFSTPEYRPHCPDEDKQNVINGVAERLKGQGDVETVDGFRIKFENGWGILRASNTEPVLSLRFEGKTEADAMAYRELFVDALAAFPHVGALD